MDRIKHTYRAIINDKFTDLISANSTKTWAGMKELLDKKMPEKKKRRWFLWFTTRAGIIAVILFSLFAAAAGAYITSDQKEQANHIMPVREQTNEIKRNELKNDQLVIRNNSPEKTNIQPQKVTKSSKQSPVIKDKGTMQTPELHTGKTNSLTAKGIVSLIQNKETLLKNAPVITLQVKDSATIGIVARQTEVTEKRRAF